MMLSKRLGYKDDAYSAFSFFMALFCQIFSSVQNTFSNQFINREEVNNCRRKFLFKSKHDVSGDGCVRTTVSYFMHKLESLTCYPREGRELHGAYTSVIQDIDVDFNTISNGYYPKGGKKSTFQEFLIYDKTSGRDCYEDRGYKHLYKSHPCCSGALCEAFCGKKNLNTRVNYKRDDIHQVENEEMSCDNMNVNYHKLAQFYEQ